MSHNILSVLLVDDDPDVRSVFELVMSHHQIPFNVIGDAETALSFLETHDPTIVVMDIFLPGMDGYQALQSLRRNARNPGCKVVATTAYYTADTEQDVQARGFDGYIPKPFDPEKLVSYLESVVN